MMKYLQKLGKSLMLPVAVLPVCSILMGIGYWIDPTGWGANSAIAAFLIKAGGSIIDNMGILFAIGVGVGMSEDNDGTGGLAALVSWLMITTLLSPAVVGMLKGIPVEEVAPAFGKIATQFTGILAGLIGSTCYNKFKGTKLPSALAFFSGKRSVAIVTAGMSIVAALILIAIIYWFFGTELGASIRATGCNPQMASAQGINTGFTKVLALMISNGLVGLSGGIYAQYQGAADVNMGRGAIVIGLAAVIISEVIFAKFCAGRKAAFAFTLGAIFIGAIIYYIVIALVLWLKMPSDYMKLFSAVVVACFLAVPYMKGKYFTKKRRTA